MGKDLNEYNKKRDFKKTKEPVGIYEKSKKNYRFVVQHHMASREHYDLRLEWQGTLKSWAVPKGPSYNPSDKRLAVLVEDHPLSYRNFEGIIPQGEYGGGTVMLFDEGTWEPINDPKTGLEKGNLKFLLKGKRLLGAWALVRMKDDNWLLVKEKDEYENYKDIKKYKRSVRTNRTMSEIEHGKLITSKNKKTKNNELVIEDIVISNGDKVFYENPKITKEDIALYYQKVAFRMMPHIENRIISAIRCPDGNKGDCFYKKHLEAGNTGIGKVNLPRKTEGKDDFYYLKDISGLINEVRMNTVEFHIWGSRVEKLEKPDLMVFDLDPDEDMNLKTLRTGVKDLKSILDELNLISFLKTSGGKGYHVVVPFKPTVTWVKFSEFAKNIAKIMEIKWPDRYTTNVRKVNRKNKIFIDYLRNSRSATSVAPYSLRSKKKATVSMPIKWSELDKVSPNEITIDKALKRLKKIDPWEDFFLVQQKLN